MRDISAKEAMENITAAQFKKNNGMVVRGAALGFPISWFAVDEMKTVLNNRTSDEALRKSLCYLTDEGYLKVRHQDTKETVDIADFEMEELEFRLSAKGTRLCEFVIKDDLIEM